jgi:hypothetical protein
MLRTVLGFVRSAIYGTLLTLSLPALLIALLCGWLDTDTAWAVKWALTVFAPFSVALYWIGFKIIRMSVTGRKGSGMWSTLLVFLSTIALIAAMLKLGIYNLRD